MFKLSEMFKLHNVFSQEERQLGMSLSLQMWTSQI